MSMLSSSVTFRAALCAALSLGALGASAHSASAEDRSKNTGKDFGELPKSVNKAIEKKLVAVSKNQEEFNDKKILKVAVYDDWGIPTRDEQTGVVNQQLLANVVVQDPQNHLCWVWDVDYIRYLPGKEVQQLDADAVGTIDCAKVGAKKK